MFSRDPVIIFKFISHFLNTHFSLGKKNEIFLFLYNKSSSFYLIYIEMTVNKEFIKNHHKIISSIKIQQNIISFRTFGPIHNSS